MPPTASGDSVWCRAFLRRVGERGMTARAAMSWLAANQKTPARSSQASEAECISDFRQAQMRLESLFDLCFGCQIWLKFHGLT